MHDEFWLKPDKIIENGYSTYTDPHTGMVFTEHDLACFGLRAREQSLDPNIFLTVPFVFADETERQLYWDKVIQPHMADPDRITMQEMMEKNLELSKQRYLEAISYIPEANRIKE